MARFSVPETLQSETVVRNRPRLEDFPDKIVTINVFNEANEEKVATFCIHKALICYYSDYFQAAFNGDFIEGQTQSLDYRYTSKLAFGKFVEWIYTQELNHTSFDTPYGFRAPSSSYEWIVDLWILADKALIPELQNLAIDALAFHTYNSVNRLSKNLCNKILQETSRDSKLRLYMVDTIANGVLDGLICPKDLSGRVLALIWRNERLLGTLRRMASNERTTAGNDWNNANRSKYYSQVPGVEWPISAPRRFLPPWPTAFGQLEFDSSSQDGNVY